MVLVGMRIQQSGAATAPAVVLLHGSGRAGRMWGPALGGLSGEWHVLTPALPGFGRSEGPFTVAGAVQAVRDTIAVQTAPVHLCGLSLGGVIAIRVAAQLGPQVASLVVTGTPVVPGRDLPAALRRFRRLPGPLLPLFSDVGGRREWLRMLDELERSHPKLHRAVLDESGRVRRHVNLFVNELHMSERDGLDTILASGDVVTLLPAVSGG